MANYTIVVDSVGYLTKDLSVRGTIKLAEEECPRKFVYYLTRRYMISTGVEEAMDSSPSHALRTNPGGLAKAQRAKYVNIYNELSDLAYICGRLYDPGALIEGADSRNRDYFLESCPNVTLAEKAMCEVTNELNVQEIERYERTERHERVQWAKDLGTDPNLRQARALRWGTEPYQFEVAPSDGNGTTPPITDDDIAGAWGNPGEINLEDLPF
jgi:hypothetical protein